MLSHHRWIPGIPECSARIPENDKIRYNSCLYTISVDWDLVKLNYLALIKIFLLRKIIAAKNIFQEISNILNLLQTCVYVCRFGLSKLGDKSIVARLSRRIEFTRRLYIVSSSSLNFPYVTLNFLIDPKGIYRVDLGSSWPIKNRCSS